jgi:hypothetical protein
MKNIGYSSMLNWSLLPLLALLLLATPAAVQAQFTSLQIGKT